MSDFAQIALLPPPPLPQQRVSVRESYELAVNAEAQNGDSIRARRFRFRVYEGSDSSTDLAARRTDSRAGVGKPALANDGGTEDATARSSSGRIRYVAGGGDRSGQSSAFLAQAFAQEQLGQGLHNPPFAAAAAAYSRTGAAVNPRAGAGLDLRA